MPSNPTDLKPWRITLVVVGLILFAAAVVMEIDILNSTTTKTETVDGFVTTTVTGKPAPAGGLVTGALGLGVACLLVASFLDRVKKISVGGIEFELDAASIGKIATLAAQRVNGDLSKIGPLVMGSVSALRAGTVTVQGLNEGAPASEVADAILLSAVESTASQLAYS